ncbi:MAG: sugar transferase [Acidobacteriota bacterium]
MGTIATPQFAVFGGRYYQAVKRLLDLGVCVVAIPIATVLGLIIGLIIFLDSRGPILFVQVRVGKKGRLFRMYKFRTLCNDGGCAGVEFMQAYIRGELDSPAASGVYKPIAGRLTPVGRLLRASSLDELPQLINVLKGEMSLVGPRPHVPTEVAAYNPWHRRRLDALPGLTGLAQVNGRSSLSFDEMVHYDVEYVEKQCLSLDLRILLATVPSVIRRAGAACFLVSLQLSFLADSLSLFA